MMEFFYFYCFHVAFTCIVFLSVYIYALRYFADHNKTVTTCIDRFVQAA